MPVKNEARLIDMHWRGVGKDVKDVSLRQPLRRGAREAIRGHMLNLGVRNSQGLDDVLDCICCAGRMLEFDVAFYGAQEVVKLAVKAEPHTNTYH